MKKIEIYLIKYNYYINYKSMMNTHYVFVYGSLRKGLSNHKLLLSSEFIDEFTSEEDFQMIYYKTKKFPYLLNDFIINLPTTKIKGEIYKISDNVLRRLDSLESHPDLYKRTLHKFKNQKGDILDALIYILVKPEIILFVKNEITENYFLAETGDWLDYCY